MPAVLAAAGVAAGAALQSATGFGFSLIAAPLVFAAVGPVEAVGALIVVGFVSNALTLAAEGRRPRPALGDVAMLVGWSLPGALAGVAVLRALSPEALQVVLSVGVVLTLAMRRRAAPRATPAWAGPIAGAAAGLLTTSTSTSGPPLVTYLLGRRFDPARFRDTITLCFLALAPIGALALFVTGTHGAVPDPVLLAILLPATVAGQVAGRPLFAHLAHGDRYEPVLTAVLLVSLVVGLFSAFTS
jgi:uncharacterized membrane protein YfcA